MVSIQLVGQVLAVVVVVVSLGVMLAGVLCVFGMACSWVNDYVWGDGTLDRPNWEQDLIDRRK